MPGEKKDLPDLRATAPAALEDLSDTTWAEFHRLQSAPTTDPADPFAPTKPTTLPGALSAQPEPATPPASLDTALGIARKSNRVCPMPEQWKQLFELMQQLAPAGTLPPYPIEGQAWKIVPPMQKRMRLREQIEWCGRYGLLAQVTAFLEALPEKGWLHF
jgi:hypothetical protein